MSALQDLLGSDACSALAGYPLAELSKMDAVEIARIIGTRKSSILRAAIDLAAELATSRLDDRPKIEGSFDAASFISPLLRNQPVETFMVLCLNSRQNVISHEILCSGLVDTCCAHPREVFRSAIVNRACSIVIAHNHPSGDPTPSEADKRITKEFLQAGKLLKIDLNDHIIIGHPNSQNPAGYFSLRENGLLS